MAAAPVREARARAAVRLGQAPLLGRAGDLLGLIVFWLLPGFETETMVFGWAHGIGFVALCVVIWVACVRHEAPYTLLAATLTPVGPVGSVIGIELIERKGWGIAEPDGRGFELAAKRARTSPKRRSNPLDRRRVQAV